MASDSSPHNVCGQILFSLKMSKLNYIVKETPFSAYITIRKKFIQSFLAPQPEIVFEKVTDTEKEIKSLIEKNKDLESKLGLITFELEESQVKIEALEKENVKLEDSIEEVYEEKRKKVKDMDKLSEENLNLKKELREVTQANDALHNKCKNVEKVERRVLSAGLSQHLLVRSSSSPGLAWTRLGLFDVFSVCFNNIDASTSGLFFLLFREMLFFI